MLVQDKSTGSLLGVVIASLNKQPLALGAVAVERPSLSLTKPASFLGLSTEGILHICELLESRLGDELQIFDQL